MSMENIKAFFTLVSAQRYFYLIAFKVDNEYNTSSFWKDCGFSIDKKSISNYEVKDFKIEKQCIITPKAYHTGDKNYSVNKYPDPPFNYDVFVLTLKKLKILIFGFPFKSLASIIMENLINRDLIAKGNFVKADINKLIKINHNSDFINDSYSAHFVGLELTLTGDTDLSTVYLDGDSPLQSSLYKNVFLKLIDDNKSKLDNCTIKFETFTIKKEITPKSKANLHIDLFGNYKFYVHLNGNNLFTIPYLFDLLNEKDCLLSASQNPLKNLKDE